VSTLIREGVDLPAINAVVLAGGGKSKTDKIQVIGRALRPENGTTADVVDLRDRGEYLGEHYELRQAALREYYGDHGPAIERNERDVRDWLESHRLPTDAFRVSESDGGRVVIDKTGYLSEDEFGRFVEAMRDTEAVEYDGEHNYVDDPTALPGVA
jgi:superfamily II DNA or RNA helicase